MKNPKSLLDLTGRIPWIMGSLTTILISAAPLMAFGDPSQAGAAAWCGARQRGASIDEANQQLRKTISANLMMSTDFASAIVGAMSNRAGMQSQIDYYISTMCPGMTYQAGPAANSSIGSGSVVNSSFWNEQTCNDLHIKGNEYCDKLQSKAKESPSPRCSKILVQFECSYKKYLSANPSVEKWAISNPQMARIEALKLKATDAENFGAAQEVVGTPAQATKKNIKASEAKCLKAADYKGCMDYHNK
ncbi:hypothetical protein KBY58_02820 [Cyanobium sp. HWJ4-Hawea]|uniref:hypothetical protein n=1 Tax=Cyanobium sp. HWJ4-Hawea TaxID=2823713 RepID=UPI0020CEE929|nr:hypothetical protein [Cyanobium sp. HWJ4-Hawea]MCP9808364.1 hypothetical protein [Cyanobium sp. HWJ4-Hawea]